MRGRGGTEQRRTVRTGRLGHSQPRGQPRPPTRPGGSARARAGGRALRLHRDELREPADARVVTCTRDMRVCCSEGLPSPPTRLCPGPPAPPPQGPSPSFTEMVGFFCRSPSKMKKRTRGMKISKAKTHWKGQAE